MRCGHPSGTPRRCFHDGRIGNGAFVTGPLVDLGVAVGGGGASLWLWRTGSRAATRVRLAALVASAGSWLPPRVARRVQHDLDAAALSIAPEVACLGWVFVTVVAGLFFGADAPLFGMVAVGVAGFGAPIGLWLARGRSERLTRAALPTTVESVASELRAGGTVVTAIVRIGESRTLLAGDLRTIAARLDLGATLGDALETWSAERDRPDVRAVAGAFTVAATVGGPAADALDALAGSLSARLAVAAETRALSAQARTSAYVVALAPFGYLLFAATVDRAALHALVGNAVGWACLLGGLTMELLAAVWMRYLLREERQW